MWRDVMWRDEMKRDAIYLTLTSDKLRTNEPSWISFSWHKFIYAICHLGGPYSEKMWLRSAVTLARRFFDSLLVVQKCGQTQNFKFDILHQFIRTYKHFWRVVLLLAVLGKKTGNFKLGFCRDTFQEGYGIILVMLTITITITIMIMIAIVIVIVIVILILILIMITITIMTVKVLLILILIMMFI